MGLLAHSLAALSAIVLMPFGLLAIALWPRWAVGVGQRLGGVDPVAPGAIWVHGASVGEVLAAVPLVEALRRSGHAVQASAMTVAGRDAFRNACPEIPCALAPLDHPWCVARALARWRPSLLVLIETELWPCWIAAAKRRAVPVVVVSGRISDRSLPRYRWLQPWLARTFERLDAVAARSSEDAERFVALGVLRDRVEVVGDLKLEPASADLDTARDLERALEGVSIFVAGSTHDGEERAALEVLRACIDRGLDVALVLAPRHLERLDAVVAGLRDAGWGFVRRSRLAGQRLASGDILLLDTLGELPGVYRAASLAFVGGTFVDVGGHNVLEPLFAGCPVVYGPRTQGVRPQVEIAEASGGGRGVGSERELVDVALRMLEDPVATRAVGERAKVAVEARRGSLERNVAFIEAMLARSRGEGRTKS